MWGSDWRFWDGAAWDVSLVRNKQSWPTRENCASMLTTPGKMPAAYARGETFAAEDVPKFGAYALHSMRYWGYLELTSEGLWRQNTTRPPWLTSQPPSPETLRLKAARSDRATTWVAEAVVNLAACAMVVGVLWVIWGWLAGFAALHNSGSEPEYTPPDSSYTALCNDGTYSDSQSRSGTCSSHDGVYQWLVP